METIAVYADRKTNKRVTVFKVELLETGARIHYARIGHKQTQVTGRSNFKDTYYNVAGIVV